MIKINLDKAKEITKDRLRQDRVPLLEENDKEYIIAIKDGLDIDPIMQERQRLLDITQLADIATTIEELKEIKL